MEEEYKIYELSQVDVHQLIHEAYENGDSESMCALGYCYENGLYGLEENKEKAFELYCMSAEKGEPNGIYNKGVCLGFAIGTGKERDAKGWLENIKKAAELGFAAAQNDYGWAWEMAKERGFFEFKDDKIAFEWYFRSANQGHKTGIENVIRCYTEGVGVEQNEAKAQEWKAYYEE